MPLAEKGVRGKGRLPLSPPQHTETPERDERSGIHHRNRTEDSSVYNQRELHCPTGVISRDEESNPAMANPSRSCARGVHFVHGAPNVRRDGRACVKLCGTAKG